MRGSLLALLVATLILSVPLAHASPPDQTWIAGWYDDGDYDNVVIAITGAVATLATASPSALEPLVSAVDVVRAAPTPVLARDAFVLVLLRAPPFA